jgi:hypothetical protein
MLHAYAYTYALCFTRMLTLIALCVCVLLCCKCIPLLWQSCIALRFPEALTPRERVAESDGLDRSVISPPGPYGFEEAVGAGGPYLTIIGLLLVS